MTMGASRVITRERMEEILSCYGGAPRAWPEEEREAALALLAASRELERHRQEAVRLDRAIGVLDEGARASAAAERVPALARRILSRLPAQEPAGAVDGAPPGPAPGRRRLPALRPRAGWRGWTWPGLALAGAVAATLAIAVLPRQTEVDGRGPLTASPVEADGWPWQDLLDPIPGVLDMGELDVVMYLEPELLPEGYWYEVSMLAEDAGPR